ncbi:envelope stress response membrane protein PspC [Sandaracinobacteroides hominis]|uniref:envelope stress response membrane protein PspC n=1 Tax=Sandaracinobacteroides hominis TaxID=2780086 RepID=UPI0018F64E41|nr:envelope stress response membrane protein PspC [Sandaracinobacteroides hominis]
MARRTGFYLDKREGKFLGVCAGIADYTGFDVLWIRVGFALAAVFGSGFPLIAYFIIAWVADSKPGSVYAQEDADPEDRRFWQKTRAAPGRSIREVRSSFRDIDRRLRDIELQYTSPQHKLAREIDELR